MLVASDGMTRGMDFERISCVINYDMPMHFRTYVHRSGRTARAGAAGAVYTILQKEQQSAFDRTVAEAGGAGVQVLQVGADAWAAVDGAVSAALDAMRSALVGAEDLGP